MSISGRLFQITIIRENRFLSSCNSTVSPVHEILIFLASKEVHKLGGESISVFIRTRKDVACHALPTEEKVKYDFSKMNAWAVGDDEIEKKMTSGFVKTIVIVLVGELAKELRRAY